MKLLSSFLILIMFSFSAHPEEGLSEPKTKRPGFIEKRQERALEIMKANFNAMEMPRQKATKSHFGFLQVEETLYSEAKN